METQNSLQKHLGVFIGIIVIVLVAGGSFLLNKNSVNYSNLVNNYKNTTPVYKVENTQTQTNTQNNNTTTKSTTTVTTTITPSYTLAQVSTHNSASSCWTAINSGVYDVTTWINSHPGGANAILSLCGTDGTAAFTGQHGGQRRPEAELKSFYIGVYAK